jgi:hypothetical protein
MIVNPLMGRMVTGKWSEMSVSTEGMATILWQYDWGPLQPHKIIPMPVIKTPSTLLNFVGSSAKYYLPSFSVKQPQDGALSGGATPVAVCFPAYCIVMQTCADIATKSFYQPLPGICFQAMTTRWVGFSVGDAIAGLIGVVGDSLAALVLSHFGGKLFSGLTDNVLFGGLGASAANVTGSALVGGVYIFASFFGVVFMGAMHAEGGIKPGTYQGIAGIILAPILSWAGGQIGSAAGDAWGSKPEDAHPDWEQAPAEPAPAAAPPPAPPASEADAGSSAPPPAALPAEGEPEPHGPPAPPDSSDSADDSAPVSSSSEDDASGGVCEPPPPWL